MLTWSTRSDEDSLYSWVPSPLKGRGHFTGTGRSLPFLVKTQATSGDQIAYLVVLLPKAQSPITIMSALNSGEHTLQNTLLIAGNHSLASYVAIKLCFVGENMDRINYFFKISGTCKDIAFQNYLA